jgi:uncharacterized protein YndB with AHSA1/START domain
MQRLTFRIEIDAPRSQVWSAMLDDATYRDWTSAFHPGSHYVGDWSEGSRILFLGPGENGSVGMVSRVRASRPHEYVELEHIGVVHGGVEDTTSDGAREWAGAHESYAFANTGGKTELVVQCDSTDEHAEAFGDLWPRALERLKAIAEADG